MKRLTTMFFAALIASAGLAAPRRAVAESINDCEKIQAADAYNQCLARFGPAARNLNTSAKEFGGDGDPGAAGVSEARSADAQPAEKSVRASRGRHHASRSSGRRSYGHARSHRVHASGGGTKRMAFNTVHGRRMR